jgi:hypothetical protein
LGSQFGMLSIVDCDSMFGKAKITPSSTTSQIEIVFQREK